MLSLWGGDKEGLGPLAGRRLQGGQGTRFSPFPTLGVALLVQACCLVDGKPGLPGPGEKMMSVGITCEEVRCWR